MRVVVIVVCFFDFALSMENTKAVMWVVISASIATITTIARVTTYLRTLWLVLRWLIILILMLPCQLQKVDITSSDHNVDHYN